MSSSEATTLQTKREVGSAFTVSFTWNPSFQPGDIILLPGDLWVRITAAHQPQPSVRGYTFDAIVVEPDSSEATE